MDIPLLVSGCQRRYCIHLNIRTPIYMIHYKNYLIRLVFLYRSGKGDFEVFHQDKDYGTIHPSTTVEDIKKEIDESEQ